MIKFGNRPETPFNLYNSNIALFKRDDIDIFLYAYRINSNWSYYPVTPGFSQEANKTTMKLKIQEQFKCGSWNYEISRTVL